MKISTGSAELDAWLDGGYESDIITTFYGAAGSGKTNLCLLAAVEQAKQGRKVIFIDTEGSFSIDRIKQLAEQKEVEKNILLLKATKFYEQHESFNKLLDLLKKDVGLIIVDSIVMLYRLELSQARSSKDEEKIYTVNRTLARQLRILSEIARKKNIPVIVTDQVYSDFINNNSEAKEKKVHMVGGDILKYWSKCIIELQRDGSRRRAILRKHRSLPEKEFVFTINDKGISKGGFRLF